MVSEWDQYFTKESDTDKKVREWREIKETSYLFYFLLSSLVFVLLILLIYAIPTVLATLAAAVIPILVGLLSISFLIQVKALFDYKTLLKKWSECDPDDRVEAEILTDISKRKAFLTWAILLIAVVTGAGLGALITASIPALLNFIVGGIGSVAGAYALASSVVAVVWFAFVAVVISFQIRTAEINRHEINENRKKLKSEEKQITEEERLAKLKEVAIGRAKNLTLGWFKSAKSDWERYSLLNSEIDEIDIDYLEGYRNPSFYKRLLAHKSCLYSTLNNLPQDEMKSFCEKSQKAFQDWLTYEARQSYVHENTSDPNPNEKLVELYNLVLEKFWNISEQDIYTPTPAFTPISGFFRNRTARVARGAFYSKGNLKKILKQIIGQFEKLDLSAKPVSKEFKRISDKERLELLETFLHLLMKIDYSERFEKTTDENPGRQYYYNLRKKLLYSKDQPNWGEIQVEIEELIDSIHLFWETTLKTKYGKPEKTVPIDPSSPFAHPKTPSGEEKEENDQRNPGSSNSTSDPHNLL